MKHKKSVKALDLKYLEKNVKDERSGIYIHRIQDHLAIHPYHLNDLNASVKELLDKGIGKYSSRLDGILCGYKNVNLLSEAGSICDDSYFIHINIEADFFLFKPSEDKSLFGVINRKSNDHLGCLVHNIFNVSLPKPKHSENWIGDSLTGNSEVALKITHTNFDGKLPYMKGEIISVVTEALKENQESHENKNGVSEKLHSSSAKKHKKIKKSENSEESSTKQEKTPTIIDFDGLQKNKRKSIEEATPPMKKQKKV